MEKHLMTSILLGMAALTGCGGGDNVSGPTVPKLVANIAVPNASSPSFSFDIGYVEAGTYFLADRNNKAVDVVDTKSNTLVAQIPGPFTGAGATTNESGPDGIVGITGTSTIYVGDVGSVKVIDTAARKTVNTIAINTSGSRVDEGCYDPDDHLVMYASPGESPPFVTFVSTLTQKVVVTLPFNGSSGLEACTYDPASKSFLINNDGTTANPDGELDVIAASSAAAGNPSVGKSFALGKCAPTGIVLGPNNDVLVGCDPSAGDPLITLILDRTSGEIRASLPFGGVDQVGYDPASNRYFLPARHYVSSGIAAESGFSPQMAVIDGASRQLLFKIPVGTGAHSVAIDSTRGQVYVPFQGGATDFPNGGVSVFSTR
ncbi:YncE family protein [Paraburkholderia terricola]|uniref:DNA-binding beta-propeller fold protein YncE n=1 Tax=Paraburkholderia terricola TaxID=169427 RepID=A0A1M6WQ66_9BURK|nr:MULTISPECIES: hypothetical protein [Paraburkholderia]SDP11536.1 DNA-binding beta-propeller fold protein YncE [Paraburkholderia sediminicola]SHK95910.1 DNA-binding beta-propeller fold protein YncE [Paraburkholderia terricola]